MILDLEKINIMNENLPSEIFIDSFQKILTTGQLD